MNKRFFVPLLIAALCQSFETQAMEPDKVEVGGYRLPSAAAPSFVRQGIKFINLRVILC